MIMALYEIVEALLNTLYMYIRNVGNGPPLAKEMKCTHSFPSFGAPARAACQLWTDVLAWSSLFKT